MRKKIISLIFLYLLAHNLISAQTYFTPIVSYDLARLRLFKFESVITGDGIYTPTSYTGFCVGAGLSQRIVGNFYLNYTLSYTTTDTDLSLEWRGDLFSWIDTIPIRYTRNSISLEYHFNKYISFGIGYDYNILKPSGELLEDPYTRQRIFRKDFDIDRGIRINIKFHYRNLEMDLYYHRGLNKLTFIKYGNAEFYPMHYFGVSLGYRIKVFDGFRKGRDRVKCPNTG